MSFQAMAAAVRFKAANSTEKLILILVANYADENNDSFPSQSRLAEDGSMSIDSVGRAMKGLEAAGAIKRVRRTRVDGTRTSDRITITLDSNGAPTPHSAPEDGEASPQSADKDGGDNSANSGGLIRCMREHEPITEPIKEVAPPSASAKSEVDIAKRIWSAVPERLKSDDGKKKLLSAVRHALAAGNPGEEMVAGAIRYYEVKSAAGEEGEAKRPNAVIGDRTWEKFLPRDDVRPRMPRNAPTMAPEAEAALRADMGTKAAPGPRLQRAWMEQWTSYEPRLRAGFWPEDRGPMPGEAGCRVSAAVQRECGVQPFEDKDQADGAR